MSGTRPFGNRSLLDEFIMRNSNRLGVSSELRQHHYLNAVAERPEFHQKQKYPLSGLYPSPYRVALSGLTVLGV